MKQSSFDAVLPDNMHTLILGSAPGKRSLLKQQYYAHKGNAFWPLAFAYWQEESTDDYAKKLQLLTRKHIGLWDVFDQFVRTGSMDHQFQHVTLQPLVQLFDTFPLSLVILNGKTATKTYDRILSSTPSHWLTLSCPSTSGANNRQQQLRKRQWFLAYQISEYLDFFSKKGLRIYFGHTSFIWEQVKQLRTAIFIEEQKIAPQDEFDDLLTHTQYEYFLVMDQEIPVATIRFQLKGTTIIQPDRFCVAKVYRNQLIGTWLLSLYETYGKFLNCVASELVAECQALPFYIKMGYQTIDAPHLVDGILCQTMQKIL